MQPGSASSMREFSSRCEQCFQQLNPYHMVGICDEGTTTGACAVCVPTGGVTGQHILRPEFSLQPDSVTKRQPIALTSPACIILLFFVVEVVLLEVVLSHCV